MAYSSEHGGIIRGTRTLGQRDPIDTETVRDGLVNGLNHVADQSGQYLVNRVPLAAVNLVSPSTTVYRKLIDVREVMLRVAPCGASFLVVPLLRASISAAGTASFWVQLAVTDFEREPLGGYFLFQKFITTTSTTAVDLAPGGMYLPAPIVRGPYGLSPESAWRSSDGGGAPMPARVMRCAIQVWAKTSLVTSVPRYHAFTAREYWHDV